MELQAVKASLVKAELWWCSLITLGCSEVTLGRAPSPSMEGSDEPAVLAELEVLLEGWKEGKKTSQCGLGIIKPKAESTLPQC